VAGFLASARQEVENENSILAAYEANPKPPFEPEFVPDWYRLRTEARSRLRDAQAQLDAGVAALSALDALNRSSSGNQ
jgi:hypothetical protein